MISKSKYLNGRYTTHEKLSDTVNFGAMERFPFVTADGKYLFFLRVSDSDDIYWINADVIKGLKPVDE